MTDKRQMATKFKCKRDESLTKQSKLVEYILEEAFEFCWSSFADEHNTLVKSTRRNVKFNKFACGPPWLPDILCKHWFMSSVWNFCNWVADVPRETSQRWRARRNDCFRRLLRFYLPLCTFQPTFLLLFIGRQCPDEEEMRELVEEFYQDFSRLHKRLRKKARVIIKLKKKYAEGKLKYLPNDKENARMWWIATGLNTMRAQNALKIISWDEGTKHQAMKKMYTIVKRESDLSYFLFVCAFVCYMFA